MSNRAISIVSGAAFILAASGSAFAADMAVKAPPPAPPPPPLTWTGFYGGVEVGGGWSDKAVNYSPNDPIAAQLLSGGFGGIGEQPVANGYRIPQSGVVGGVEAGYNWQAGSNWLLGLEADFSWTGMRGTASGTSIETTSTTPIVLQTTNAEQSTEWYGTVRGRAGWLATPNLLLFGTGGFAYGRVGGSANYVLSGNPNVIVAPSGGGFGFACPATGVICFAGSSSDLRTGWTAGGGVEWLFDQHWSAKIEYQFVDLGSETVRITGTPCPSMFCIQPINTSSFNAIFHNQFNVVRVGLNYQFH